MVIYVYLPVLSVVNLSVTKMALLDELWENVQYVNTFIPTL